MEAFVGRDFLPRGTGIVTRRPLILQMIHNKKEEYAFFSHTKTKFTDFIAIRDEITRATRENEECQRTGVSKNPIRLKIFSPNVLNLTLIDLPGMTVNAMPGQPANIREQIEDLILAYIQKPSCIILAVSPANSDLANSDAINLAKRVDPEGQRTIGVMTKLDIMDHGTNAMHVFNGESDFHQCMAPYIGVVNRSQKDIQGNKDIKAAIRAEHEFFNHPKSPYVSVADRMGTPYLQSFLSQQLKRHLLKNVPKLRSEFKRQLNQINFDQDQEDILFEMDEDYSNPRVQLHLMLEKFKDNFYEHLDSNTVGRDLTLGADLTVGSRIYRLFYQYFLQEEPLLYSEYKDGLQSENPRVWNEINIQMQNVRGLRSTTYIEKVLECVVRAELKEMAKFPQHAITLIEQEVQAVIPICSEHLVDAYPHLKFKIDQLVTDCLVKARANCDELIEEYFDWESSMINTNHKDFTEHAKQSGITDLAAIIQPRQAPTGEENIDPVFEEQAGLVYDMVLEYLQVIMNTSTDLLPKMIVSVILRETKTFVKQKLYLELEKLWEECPEYAEECPEVTQKREAVQAQKKMLENAVNVLSKLGSKEEE